MATKRFEIGKTYFMRSVCNSECVWTYKVINRTNSTVTLKDECDKITRCRINQKEADYFKCENVRPLGTYSMSPVLYADKIY